MNLPLNNTKLKLLSMILAAAMIISMIPAAAFADEGGSGDINSEPVPMTAVSIGGVNYYFADTENGDENTVYKVTVSSRQGSNEYYFNIADLTEIKGTSYWYTTLRGATPLTGTLYGYGEGTVTTYRDVYGAMDIATDESDESYDAVSSATNYASHHAGDIPSNAVFSTDADGNKAITGLNLNRKRKTVEAQKYVEASIIKAAGGQLSEEQAAVLDITLKVNPMVAPSDKSIPAKFGSAEYVYSKYGVGEINIYPDTTVEGYVWNEYLDSIYAATISDGVNTAGAVYWIDLYGEKATSGYHFNKVEFELNNGMAKADNYQIVNRYSAFLDQNTGFLKPGVYTVSVYAEGYDVVTGTIEIKEETMETVSAGGVFAYKVDTAGDENTIYKAEGAAANGAADSYFLKDDLTEIAGTDSCYIITGIKLADKTVAYTGKEISYPAAVLNGIPEAVTYTYFSDEACTKALASAPKKVGTYYVRAAVGELTSDAAKLTISKAANKITKIAPASKTYKTSKAKKLKSKKTFKLSAKLKTKAAVTYKATKFGKKAKKYVSVSKKGVVTVKKNTPKGTYKVTVKATSAASNILKSATVTKVITVKVK